MLTMIAQRGAGNITLQCGEKVLNDGKKGKEKKESLTATKTS